MNAAVALNLPDILREHTKQLEQALATPVLAGWPEGTAFADAPQPEAIGRVLVDAIHTDLQRFEIGYLFREKMQEKGKFVLAKASKVSGKLRHFAQIDFLVEVNWEQWRLASREQRIALIDHELCHCVCDWNDAGDPVSAIVTHDIEEFRSIVKRWGLWKNDVRTFAAAMEHAKQLGLFDTPSTLEAAD